MTRTLKITLTLSILFLMTALIAIAVGYQGRKMTGFGIAIQCTAEISIIRDNATMNAAITYYMKNRTGLVNIEGYVYYGNQGFSGMRTTISSCCTVSPVHCLIPEIPILLWPAAFYPTFTCVIWKITSLRCAYAVLTISSTFLWRRARLILSVPRPETERNTAGNLYGIAPRPPPRLDRTRH